MKTSEKEWAREYAARLVQVKKSAVAKSLSGDNVKIAKALNREEFKSAVKEILAEIDGLIYTTSKAPVSQQYKDTILAEMDQALGFAKGTMVMVKKGSIMSALQFDAAVEQAYDAIDFV